MQSLEFHVSGQFCETKRQTKHCDVKSLDEVIDTDQFNEAVLSNGTVLCVLFFIRTCFIN